jgi:hypothetical protein
MIARDVSAAAMIRRPSDESIVSCHRASTIALMEAQSSSGDASS